MPFMSTELHIFKDHEWRILDLIDKLADGVTGGSDELGPSGFCFSRELEVLF
jgi:hypothetical protein